MNKFTLLISCLLFINLGINAQEIVLAGWTFPGSSAGADEGTETNIGSEIFTMGGTSDIDFKNGLESKAAQVTEWNDGMDIKAWVIEVSTVNFESLTISSLQQSGGNDPGPKDFKLQYSIENDVWVDIPGGTITTANDWTSSAVENLALPVECNDKEMLQIRWVMTSNEASGSGGAVLESGKNKIENVFVRGEVINGINDLSLESQINVYPNPSNGLINLGSDLKIESVQVLSIIGKVERIINFSGFNEILDFRDLPKGNYILRIKMANESELISKKVSIL